MRCGTGDGRSSRALLQRVTCHTVIRRTLRPSVPTAGYLSCCDTTDALPLDPIRATLQDGGDKRRGRPPTVCGDLPREVFTVLRP